MKKYTIVYVMAAALCVTMFSSYHSGPAQASGWDCTGAETGLQNPSGCSTTGGCHSTSATSGIGISIELDSVGIATTHYVGGGNYTVKLIGTNNTNSTLPFYGFQMGAITGSTAVSTPTNAGTWTLPCPTGTHFTSPQAGNFVVNIVEQNSSQSPATGNGGNGTKYSKIFNWTAPAKGTGTVSFWAALNAVNGNGQADGSDLWNTNHIVINELVKTGISSVKANLISLSVYPNPVQSNFNLSYFLTELSNVAIQLVDLEGKVAVNLINEIQNSGQKNMNIQLPSELRDGIYILKIDVNNTPTYKKIIINR